MGPCPTRLPSRGDRPAVPGGADLIDPAAGSPCGDQRRRPCRRSWNRAGIRRPSAGPPACRRRPRWRCRTPRSSSPGSERLDRGRYQLDRRGQRDGVRQACAARGVADRGGPASRDRLQTAPRARGRSMRAPRSGWCGTTPSTPRADHAALAGDRRQLGVAAGRGRGRVRFDGTVRRLLDQRGTLRDGWVATMTREDPRTPRRGWCRSSCSATGWYSGRSSRRRRPGRRGVLGPADPALAGQPAPPVRRRRRPELPGAHLARRRDRAGLVPPMRDERCLGSIGLEGLSSYAPRAEIGYWAHPQARGRGTVTAVRLVTGYARPRGWRPRS